MENKNDAARCPQCQGTGRCLSCQGAGNTTRNFYSAAGDCNHCSGYGWCQHCKGSAEDPSGTPTAATLPVDANADALRDGLLAVRATEDNLLADLRERRVRDELAALTIKSGEDIDFSDIPATTDSDWDGAERGKFYRPR